MLEGALVDLLIEGFKETTYMVLVSSLLSAVIGIPLGVVLITTDRGHILENLPFNRILGAIVNAARSTPFIILMVAIIPLTKLIVGTSIGTEAAMVPLTLAAIPFVGRLVETSLKEVEYGVIEAAQSMGATPLQIIWRVMIPEAMPSIIAAVTTTIINLINYSAMAGAIGGGGLGDIAIRYGYQRFRVDMMIITIVLLIIQVQIVQSVGDFIAKRLDKR